MKTLRDLRNFKMKLKLCQSITCNKCRKTVYENYPRKQVKRCKRVLELEDCCDATKYYSDGFFDWNDQFFCGIFQINLKKILCVNNDLLNFPSFHSIVAWDRSIDSLKFRSSSCLTVSDGKWLLSKVRNQSISTVFESFY